jgi:Ca2+-binding RTX toxin-like protein
MSSPEQGPKPLGDSEIEGVTGGTGTDGTGTQGATDMVSQFATGFLGSNMQALYERYSQSQSGSTGGGTLSIDIEATMQQGLASMQQGIASLMDQVTVSYQSLLDIIHTTAADQMQSLLASQPGYADQYQAMQAALLSGADPTQTIAAALQAGTLVLPGLPIWSPNAAQPDGQGFLDLQAQYTAAGGGGPQGAGIAYAQQSLASFAPYLQQNPGIVNDPVYGPAIAALQNMVSPLQGGDGSEALNGRGLADQIRGGGGDDVITGNAATTSVQGLQLLAGQDTIDGGAGRDTIIADGLNPNAPGGADYVTGGVGDHAADLVSLGGGDDIYVWRPGDGNDVVSFGTGSTDRLLLTGVTPTQLAAGLQLPPGVFLQEIPGNPFTFRFIDGIGRQVEGNGTFTMGGETLTFTGADILRLPFPGQVG